MNGIILGGRYELLEKIGEGGMSEVYKAKCNKLNRFVAVKILKKQFADNEEIAQKFKREATAIANLSDTNIVNILDVGTQEDIDYIVMEYVSGKTLKELINYSGKLSYTTAIKIALQIAKALDCAHRNNIIHRDIKPQNILVTEAGEVKVTDFGIAKSTDSQTITNTTSIIGSAHYLSPEQAKGTYIDFRSDIYSFGIVLYEMVTGRLPFEGDSPVTVALKHLQEEPVPPKNINSAIPDSLNKLILKAIKKEPIKRYQNAKEIIQDLQKIQENPDIIIGDNINNNDNTIIMAPINTIKSSNISKAEDDYYDDEDFDDEYDEDFDDDYEDKPKKKNNKKTLKKILISIGVILIILILGSVGFFLAGGTGNSKEIEVPNIVGSKFDDAKKQFEALGLKLEIKTTEKSDKPENTILETDPKAGMKVKKGTVINVIVSAGEEQIDMPDVRNYEKTTIEQTLKSKGLNNYIITEEYNDTIEVGYFIRQNPAAGTKISKNTEINIVISKGPETKFIDVANVIDKTLADAKEALKGFEVKVIEEVTHDESKDGIVLSQDNQGKKLQEGATVTITVGKYEVPLVDIRNEVGLAENQTLIVAKSRAEGAGFKVEVNGPNQDDAIVTGFTEKVEKGGTITINTKKVESENPQNNNGNSAGNNSGHNGSENNNGNNN
ncbi:Stk1 family PASTA domain-containing Ser/Thr kinase [Clostridium sp. Sa3CUN1]|uniref:non-specific serine/threonine protein kinase n=1 Tax=Clostridium gallinarum TaxID=2762246 RepID=A0ABR8Q116_9CLOT|nr:Stk1 family PASTA domain-containing Ser/Thr kinase [Clostridium gallinarum]MBD7914113.1 Stk1 family PASTA domain-containing Ser/Thr kinase [Clostridium gallinarum]